MGQGQPKTRKAPKLKEQRVLCWETGDSLFQIRRKSDIASAYAVLNTIVLFEINAKNHQSLEPQWTKCEAEGEYLSVKLPKKRSEVLLFFDYEEKSHIRTESEILSKINEEDDYSKDYIPFVKLHLDRIGWVNRTMLRIGKLDNTLYVSRTGVLGGSSNDSLPNSDG